MSRDTLLPGNAAGHIAKRRRVEPPTAAASVAVRRSPIAKKSRIFAPYKTIGLVSPTAVPFTAVPLGKTTFQITTSVGRSLQTYDLRRGLQLVFITRPQTPGLFTATAAWNDKVIGAWSASGAARGVWVFKRGKKEAELHIPSDIDQDIVQLLVLGSWIIACCTTKILVWESRTLDHYTTLDSSPTNILTGGLCSIPTYTNKILAGRDSGAVELWNIKTGRLLYTFHPPTTSTGPVTALQSAPALHLFAVAYLSGTINIHDLRYDSDAIISLHVAADHTPISTLTFRTDNLGAGPDGQVSGMLATASYNSGDVTIWDLNDGGKRIATLRSAHSHPEGDGTGGGVSGAEFLPGQAILVTTGLDNALKTWIFDEVPYSAVPRLLHERRGHGGAINCLAFLPPDSEGAEYAGKWLMSGGADRSFWSWSLRRDNQSGELSQGKLRRKAKAGSLMSSTSGPRGDAEGTEADNARRIDRQLEERDLRAPEITCIASSMNRDGGIATLPGVTQLWATAKQVAGKSTATEQNVTGWESVVTGHRGDKYARTWFWGRKRAGRWLLETGDGREVTAVAMSPCGTFAVVGSAGGGVDGYNLQSGLHRQRFPGRLTKLQAQRLKEEMAKRAPTSLSMGWKMGQGKHSKAITGLHVDNMNRTMVSSSLDGKLKFWDFHTSLLLAEVTMTSPILSLRAFRANDLIALACADGCVRVVDITTHRIVRELHPPRPTSPPRNQDDHDDPEAALMTRADLPDIKDHCFSPDGRWVITTSADSTIRTYDLPTSHLIDAIRLRCPASSVAFSTVGDFLAVAMTDSVGVDLWSNKTLFHDPPTRQLNAGEYTLVEEGPTASGEGGQGVLAFANAEAIDAEHIEADLEANDSDDNDLELLSGKMTTLSVVPTARWQTLLNLDGIRERNKPIEPPKAPEQVPFFLPALQSLQSLSTEAGAVVPRQQGMPIPLATNEPPPDTTTQPLSRIRARAASAARSETTTLLLAARRSTPNRPVPGQAADETAVETFLSHLKTLNASEMDVAIRSLSVQSPYVELTTFLRVLTVRLRQRRDFELVQAWMAVFLRCHADVLMEVVASSGLADGGKSGDGIGVAEGMAAADGLEDMGGPQDAEMHGWDEDASEDASEDGSDDPAEALVESAVVQDREMMTRSEGGGEGEGEGYSGEALVAALGQFRELQRVEGERLTGLIAYCKGVIGFMRSTR